MELARAFPNIAQQACFHPKQSTFNSLVGRVPRSKTESSPVAIKGAHTPSDEHLHHE